MARIGYARVPTTDQNLTLQRDALAAAECELQSLASVRTGDVLLVWKLDRLSRSLPHLVDTVRKLEGQGVGPRCLTGQIDTTTSKGHLVCHLFGALGKSERDLIRERTPTGLTAAEARGGRKPVITKEKLSPARNLVAKGLTMREAATRLKVDKIALFWALGGAV
jgi:DNA invertase Pin-like site-specific DNA recombinase